MGAIPSTNETSDSAQNTGQVSNKLAKKMYYVVEEYYCPSCDIYLSNRALIKCHCMKHLFQKYVNQPQNDVIRFTYIGNNDVVATCLCCQKIMTTDLQLIDHIVSSQHKSEIASDVSFYWIGRKNNGKFSKSLRSSARGKLEVTNEIMVYRCTACNVTFPESEIQEHITSIRHCENVRMYGSTDLREIRAEEHEDVSEKQDPLNDKNIYICFACNESFQNVSKLLRHYNEKNHQDLVGIYASRPILLPTEELSPKSSVVEERSTTLLHNKSDELREKITTPDIDLNELLGGNRIDKEIAKQLKRRQKTRGRAKFNTNIFTHGNTYIEMCIEKTSDNIYNIDEGTVSKQITGSQFIVPYEFCLYCTVCDLEFSSDVFNAYSHLRKLEHIANVEKQGKTRRIKQKSELSLNDNEHDQESGYLENSLRQIYREDMWYYAQVFVCIPCKSKFDFELVFVIHLKSQKHSRSARKYRQMKRMKLKFDVCLACTTCWLGTHKDYYQHCKTIMHKSCSIKLDFHSPELVPIVRDFLINAEDYLEKLVKASDEVAISEQQEKEQKLVKSIENLAESIFPAARAYVFGSRLSHIGFPDSDVDVFLDCKNVYYDEGSAEKSKRYLKRVKSLIAEQEDNWIIYEVLLQSRVPIITLRHIDTCLKCDISFTNGLSVEKSKLIRKFNEASEICRKMILYLKKWLNLCHLSGSDGITTYAMCWFVIFFLQNQGILPTVHELLKLKSQPEVRTVAGWDCPSEETSISAEETNLSFKELILKFYSFYVTFDFHRNVVCPFLGRIMPKKCFANPQTLPDEFSIYKQRIQEIENFRLDSPMCIQDPMDHSQNMTKAVSKYQLRCFMDHCQESIHVLNECDTT